MAYVSWFPIGFGIGLFVSLSIFLANRNKHGEATVLGELLGLIAIFTIAGVVGNVQAILSSYGVQIDFLYGIVAGLILGAGISFLSLISRTTSLAIRAGGVAFRGVGGVVKGVRKTIKDERKKMEDAYKTIAHLNAEIPEIKKEEIKEIRELEEVRHILDRAEEFLNEIKRDIAPYFYYRNNPWWFSTKALFVGRSVMKRVESRKTEAIAIFSELSGLCIKVVNEFEKTLRKFREVNAEMVRIEGDALRVCEDLEKDLMEFEKMLKDIENVEKKLEVLDENALSIDEKMEALLQREGISIKELKELTKLVVDLHKRCSSATEEVRKLERVDISVIKKVHSEIANVVNKKYHSNLNKLIKEDLKIVHNLEVAFKDEKSEIEETSDPVQILKHFGIGINKSLRKLEEAMHDFLLALDEEKREINIDFEKIKETIAVAEQELAKINTIVNALKKIGDNLRFERKEVAKIDKLFTKFEGILTKLEKEVGAIAKKEEEKLTEKEIEAIERYEFLKARIDQLEKAFKSFQSAQEEIQEAIKKVRDYVGKMDRRPFDSIMRKVSTCRNKLENAINRLENTVRRYGNIFEGLRVRILYEVKNLCRELLQIEREVKEAEKTRKAPAS
jgi:DNA repair exonuclease SbcCD ATPase subunit